MSNTTKTKRSKIKIALSLFFALLLATTIFMAAGCSFLDGLNRVRVTGVSLEQNLTVAQGQTIIVTPTITPSNATNRSVNFSITSSNPTGSIIIDSYTANSAVIRGVQVGTGVLQVTTATGGYTATTTITVSPAGTITPDTPSVSIDQIDPSVRVGTHLTLTATTTNYDCDGEIIWYSYDTNIATINETTGEIDALEVGFARIYAKLASDNTVYDYTYLMVYTPSIALDSNYIIDGTLTLGLNDYNAVTAVLVDGQSLAENNRTIIWTTDNSNIAYIAAPATGNTATIRSSHQEGTTTINAILAFSAEWDNPIKTSFSVTVVAHQVTGLTLDYTNLDADFLDGSVTLTATITPSYASNQNILWSSSNNAIATVNNGVVTFVGRGTVVISAVSVSNPGAFSQTTINISRSIVNYNVYAGQAFPNVRIQTGSDERTSESYFGLTRNTWNLAAGGATISIDGAWNDEYNFDPVPVDVRGRGNSTWWNFRHSKQPIRVRFPNNVASHRSMLDSGYAARNWSFIAAHSDMSQMRHYAAHHMGRRLDTFSNVAFKRFVHLYINDQYRGIFQLTDHMDNCGQGNRANIDWIAGRVNAANWTNEHLANTEFYIEMCRRARGYGGAAPADFWFMAGGNSFEFREDSGMNVNPTHANRPRTLALIEEARQFTQLVHDTIMGGNWNAIQAIVDIPSLVDFYIVNEVFKDVDVAFSSVHMTIRNRIPGDGSTRMLHMGPLWDFDLAAGNAYYFPAVYGGYGPIGTGAKRHPWFNALVRNVPQFRTAVIERFEYFYTDILPETIERIQNIATLREDCFMRNFNLWPILGVGVWPNPISIRTIDTFMGQVNHVAWFLNTRANWMWEMLYSFEYRLSIDQANASNAPIYIASGGSRQLSASIFCVASNSYITDDLIWTDCGTNNAISVNSNGLVTANGLGTATIRVSKSSNPRLSASVTIQSVPRADDLYFSIADLTLFRGDVYRLFARPYPSTAWFSDTVVWSSTNSGVSVYNGIITIENNASGTAIIQANSGGLTASLIVTVNTNPKALGAISTTCDWLALTGHTANVSLLSQNHFLVNDLDFYGLTVQSIGSPDAVAVGIGHVFNGTLDGRGRVIKNITITGAPTVSSGTWNGFTHWCATIFGGTGINSQIRNLTVKNSTALGTLATGILVGNNRGLVENVSLHGTFANTNIGLGAAWWYRGGPVFGRNYGTVRNVVAFGRNVGQTFIVGGGLGGGEFGTASVDNVFIVLDNLNFLTGHQRPINQQTANYLSRVTRVNAFYMADIASIDFSTLDGSVWSGAGLGVNELPRLVRS